MKLPSVYRFLQTLPRYRESGDGVWIQVQCPFCGDSQKSNNGHFSIKVDVDRNEPMCYKCFRADCGEKGLFTTDTLKALGCSDINVLSELANHNKNCGGKVGSDIIIRDAKPLVIANVNRTSRLNKLQYINDRLGTKFSMADMEQFKIQLNLYDFLEVNSISKLAFPRQICDLIDQYCIGFISIYGDYIIFRDITKGMVTGKRYQIYRTIGRPQEGDLKLYSIPSEIDLLDPQPAILNIAEGPFSILGAYLYGKIGKDARNSIWLANCGSDYEKSIKYITKRYGLLTVRINIWSDSEIPIKRYEALKHKLDNHMKIKAFHVYYNTKSDDFGHPVDEIHPKRIVLE